MEFRYEVKLTAGTWFVVTEVLARDYFNEGASVRRVALHNYKNGIGHEMQECVEVAIPTAWGRGPRKHKR